MSTNEDEFDSDNASATATVTNVVTSTAPADPQNPASGGSYVRDPVSGELLQVTAPPAAAPKKSDTKE